MEVRTPGSLRERPSTSSQNRARTLGSALGPVSHFRIAGGTRILRGNSPGIYSSAGTSDEAVDGPGRFCEKLLIEPRQKRPWRRGYPAPRTGSTLCISSLRERAAPSRHFGARTRSSRIHALVPRDVSARPTHSQSRSPRNYARDPRAVASGRPGGEEGTPAEAPAGPAPVLVLCSTCRQPIRRNESLRISFCPIHGLSEPFTLIPFTWKRPRGV